MTGGMEVEMTPWAGLVPLIEAMRKIEVIDKANNVLPPKRSSKGLPSGQTLECYVQIATLGDECLGDHGAAETGRSSGTDPGLCHTGARDRPPVAVHVP